MQQVQNRTWELMGKLWNSMYSAKKKQTTNVCKIIAKVAKAGRREATIIYNCIANGGVVPVAQIDNWLSQISEPHSVLRFGKVEDLTEIVGQLEGRCIDVAKTQIDCGLILTLREHKGEICVQQVYVYMGAYKNIFGNSIGNGYFSSDLDGFGEYCAGAKKRRLPVIPMCPRIELIVMTQQVAAIVVHEIAHTFENPKLKTLCGARIMREDCFLVDHACQPFSWANYCFDDFGMDVTQLSLIQEGCIEAVYERGKGRDVFGYSDSSVCKAQNVNIAFYATQPDGCMANWLQQSSKYVLIKNSGSAKQNGREVWLTNCECDIMDEGERSVFIPNVSFPVSEFFRKLLYVGNSSAQFNGFCSNQRFVSYASPALAFYDLSVSGGF